MKPPGEGSARIAEFLETIYHRFNDRRYVPPDPLMFVHRYHRPEDREVVALIASSLAVGRVEAIAGCVERVLGWLGPNPAQCLLNAGEFHIRRWTAGFRYRFFDARQMGGLLAGLQRVLRRYGSLEACMEWACREKGEDMAQALDLFAATLGRQGEQHGAGRLLPLPRRGSACKRLHLFLRWMVRWDNVDPGGWNCLRPDQLQIPLDTHMFRIGRCLGFTCRKQADGRAAREITQGFARLVPTDPVRYDFALTRLGMRHGVGLETQLKDWSSGGSQGGDA
ncbi:TIGR02757 family protein [Desulfacinum hydrothermale DSM 13146]|uniref:TIGR02757 family protein n=1 Tax=Desulfacinum hydrothermale DSM 13146 TaxID=1121390 RepID=A0A1W1XT25_9BACT|nr:TIGR02757 family protein [Desulfacinum hydrothermale]SMC27046.1 TIGR02757 family protein [Desulfacinum hydrothermale DSM 13146]